MGGFLFVLTLLAALGCAMMARVFRRRRAGQRGHQGRRTRAGRRPRAASARHRGRRCACAGPPCCPGGQRERQGRPPTRARREGRGGGHCGHRSRAASTCVASRRPCGRYHRAGSSSCLTRARVHRLYPPDQLCQLPADRGEPRRARPGQERGRVGALPNGAVLGHQGEGPFATGVIGAEVQALRRLGRGGNDQLLQSVRRQQGA
jgi:hypothetical protein